MRAVWRFFSSIRLALFLIIFLALVSLAGALVIQIPLGMAGNETAVREWLENYARPVFGFGTDFLWMIGIFNIFHAMLFVIPGVLLIINIICCGIKRWPSLRINTKHINYDEAVQLLGNSNDSEFRNKSVPLKATAEIADVFNRFHYRFRQQNRGQDTVFIAEKNRFTPWGTYLVHFSLILLIAGYLIGNYFGFEENSFIVPENTKRSIGNGYDLSIWLKDFNDNYWPDGTPRDYVSYISLIKDNMVIKEGEVRVNHPMSYNGLSIYQAFFGPAVSLKITDNDGNEIYHNIIALSNSLQTNDVTRPYGIFSLPENKIIGYLVGPTTDASGDPVIPSEELGLELYSMEDGSFINWARLQIGITSTLEGLNINIENKEQFSGFQIKRDPGLPLIWSAFAMFIIGLILMLYFPNRRILILVQPDNEGNQSVCTFRYGKKELFDNEREKIAEELGYLNNTISSENVGEF